MLAILTGEPWPAFAVGDVPSSPLTVTLDTAEAWTGVESPDAAAVTYDPGAFEVSVTLPALEVAGVLPIRLTLTGAAGARATVEPLLIVVEDPADGWHTLATARREWPDAPEDDVTLFDLLTVARGACEEYAPLEGAGVPTRYRTAQLMQARAVWTASRATSGDRMGGDEYGVTVYPLDWNVKQTLRPRAALGGMF